MFLIWQIFFYMQPITRDVTGSPMHRCEIFWFRFTSFGGQLSQQMASWRWSAQEKPKTDWKLVKADKFSGWNWENFGHFLETWQPCLVYRTLISWRTSISNHHHIQISRIVLFVFSPEDYSVPLLKSLVKIRISSALLNKHCSCIKIH